MPRNPTGCGSIATWPCRSAGLPLAAPLALLMAVPQMLASVIGLSPYARSIHYQYTAMMIAPLVIAAIEGARLLWRFRVDAHGAADLVAAAAPT